ncbi:hypothetical protein N0V93_000726 [Gnomoniopsis smithogilvyi]|uniref:Amino acid transporter n=1 Tax=Gnomoniopsis smithogilvyi TaxID=1191159 RepID=A0A9W8Z4J2_9PEZI|nr:hypothetical protein N0V93_000726 [Gnomoniopsis smithogilvyi]
MDAAFTPLVSDDPDAIDSTEHGSGAASGLVRSRSSSRSSIQVRPPKLTLLNGLALVISLQIGSGIFTIPSQVSQFVPSPGVGLVVWLVAGLLVWTGAASFIELGLRVPSNGGIQEYLRAAYGGCHGEEDKDGIIGPRGELAGFLFTWTWVFLAKPAANGAIATIAANYLSRPFIGDTSLSPLMSRLVALACIAFVTFVNCLGASSGAKAANVFLMLKLSALCSIIILGLATWLSGRGGGVPSSPGTGWFAALPETSGELSLGNFVTGIFGAVFCYGGWETIGFVLGDMANPEGDLPIVITSAMVIVICGFSLMNAAIYVVLPFETVRTSTTVAVEFARQTIGPVFGIVFSVVVSISALGSLNANVFATSKLCVAASHRSYFPRALANQHCSSAQDEADYLNDVLPFCRGGGIWLARLSENLRWNQDVPIFALLLNGILAAFFVIMGSFNGLVTLIGLAEYSCFLAAVVGLLLMRRREVAEMTTHRHRTWIGNPLIFTSVSAFLVLRAVITDPLQGLAIVSVLASGVAAFGLRFGFRVLLGPSVADV